jgi:hypothetical protein
MRHIMNPIDETLTVQLVCEGEGWVGFGYFSNGRMTGASAVIGLLDEALGPTKSMEGISWETQTLGAVQRMPDEAQTLTDASIYAE